MDTVGRPDFIYKGHIMLDMNFDFYFPRLVHHAEATLKGALRIQLYKLDWHKKPGGLPEQYDSIIKDMVFHLDGKYLAEIHHCCQMALIERGKQRPFDTMIRDVCQEPVHGYVFVAFRLMCDCIFDEERHYYREHDWVRRISWHAMLYKFWHGQTGGGLLWDRAKMEELEPEQWKGWGEPLEPEAEQFYFDMKAYNELALKPKMRVHSPEKLDALVELVRKS